MWSSCTFIMCKSSTSLSSLLVVCTWLSHSVRPLSTRSSPDAHGGNSCTSWGKKIQNVKRKLFECVSLCVAECAALCYLLFWIIRSGIGPFILSIIARCSLLSWVYKVGGDNSETAVVTSVQHAAILQAQTHVWPGTVWSLRSTQIGCSRYSRHHRGGSIPALWEEGCIKCLQMNWTDSSWWLSKSKPAALTQDDLWCSVVTRRDDGWVVFMVKGGAAKVNKSHCCVVYSALAALLKEDRRQKSP